LGYIDHPATLRRRGASALLIRQWPLQPQVTERTRWSVYNPMAGAESQQIVATRPLYCLQYPASTKSSAKD